MLDTSRISTRGKIWELHIHSNQCFSADENLKRLSVDEYVTQLLDVLEPYADLDMISFTDHNHISSELYRSFIEQNSKITLLPGVEVDTALQKDGIAKHIIVYFDAVDDADKIDLIAERLNAFFQDKKVGSQKGQAPIYIYELLDMLASLNVEFVLSPHAMKQGKEASMTNGTPWRNPCKGARSRSILIASSVSGNQVAAVKSIMPPIF